jgi:hypothetical protein
VQARTRICTLAHTLTLSHAQPRTIRFSEYRLHDPIPAQDRPMHIERAASIDKVAAVEVHGRVNVGAVGDGGQVLLCAMLMLAMLGVFQNGVRLCSCGKKKGLFENPSGKEHADACSSRKRHIKRANYLQGKKFEFSIQKLSILLSFAL